MMKCPKCMNLAETQSGYCRDCAPRVGMSIAEMSTDLLRTKADDPVNRPQHYTSHPSGIECIQITEHMGFNLGNATKYIWRCDLKKDAIEDLKKARWYLDREIAKREKAAK